MPDDHQPASAKAKFWMEQCYAAVHIRDRFGLTKALDYIVGEKLANLLEFLALLPDRAVDLPQFVAEIRSQFTEQELRAYFDQVRRRRGGTHRHRAALRQAQLLLLHEK